MRTGVAAALAALSLAAGARAAEAPKKGGGATVAASPELAKSLVEAVRVNADEVVLVHTTPQTLPLAELVVAELSKKGALALVDLSSPQIARAVAQHLPENELDRPSPYGVQLSGVNAIIELSPSDDPALEAGADPARVAKLRRGRIAAMEQSKLYEKDVRRVVLGGTSFPSDEAAKLYRTDANQIAKAFWDGVAVKGAILDDRTERVRKVLSGFRVVKITGAGGTDLEVRLAGNPITTNTGRITDEVLARQGVKETSLPAGEVTARPNEFTANGTLFVDAVECNGVLVRDVKASFKDGKLSLESGGENFEVLKKAFEQASDAKGIIASLTIGTNEAARVTTGFYRSPEMSGVVGVGVGYNKPIGGSNDTNFALRFLLGNATLKVDGTPLVEGGQLKLK